MLEGPWFVRSRTKPGCSLLSTTASVCEHHQDAGSDSSSGHTERGRVALHTLGVRCNRDFQPNSDIRDSEAEFAAHDRQERAALPPSMHPRCFRSGRDDKRHWLQGQRVRKPACFFCLSCLSSARYGFRPAFYSTLQPSVALSAGTSPWLPMEHTTTSRVCSYYAVICMLATSKIQDNAGSRPQKLD